MNFASRFKELRQFKDKTMKEIAHDLDLSESTISMYESGQREPKTTQDLITIAMYFDVTVDYLIGHEKDNLQKELYNLIEVCNSLDIKKIELLIEIAKNFT